MMDHRGAKEEAGRPMGPVGIIQGVVQVSGTRKLVHSSDKYRQKRAYERPDTEQSEEMHQDAEKGSPMSKDFIV